MNFDNILAVIQKTDASTKNMNVIIIVAIIVIIILIASTIFVKKR